MKWKLLRGDCIERMRQLPDNKVDAIVCDPPYGLEFMGKEWDKLQLSDNESGPQSEGWHDNGGKNPYARRATPRYAGKKLGAKTSEMQAQQAWHEAWAREAFRVLKPGGHLVAFGGTRTYHRLACALEDAGFEIRDSLMWLYGSGFPKSLNLDGEREGWGTALKPAHEPCVLARKPLEGTVAANVQKWGTGALNIDGCRVGYASDADKASAFPGGKLTSHGSGSLAGPGAAQDAERSDFKAEQNAKGRWPANVVLDEEAGALLDAQSGERRSAGDYPSDSTTRNGVTPFDGKQGRLYADKGGASRFFYCPKVSRKERGEGNNHPTVKPIALMAWIIRLVTPPGGVVLDPFMGSGSTGIAALREGCRFIGIERDKAYFRIAKARVRGSLT